MSAIHEIGDTAKMDGLIAHAVAQGAGHSAELFRAARRGEIAVLLILPATPAPMKWLRRTVQPVVAVIGDDPGDLGLGPRGWLAARRLVAWASFAVVHTSGGTVADYKFITSLAKVHGRLLLVETTTTHGDAWAAMLLRRKPRPLPFVGFVPHEGVHPIMPPRSAAP